MPRKNIWSILLVISYVRRAGSLKCVFSSPGGAYHNIEQGKSDNSAKISGSCRDTSNVSVCVDTVTSPDVKICKADEGNGSCSEWKEDECLHFSSGSFAFRARAEEEGVKCILLHEQVEGEEAPRSTSAFNLYTRDPGADDEERRLFAAQLVLICSMNFFVGICLDLEQLRAEAHKGLMAAMSVREWDPGSIFKMRAWKLGLLAQFLFLPVLSYLVGLALFRESADCSYVGDLSRLGLFVLGTSPTAAYCTWVSRLFLGNMDVSVLIAFFSILGNPLSVFFWWWALGQGMGVQFPTDVPVDLIYTYFAIIMVPIVIGAIFIWRFPSFAENLAYISPPLFAMALLGSIVIASFHAARISLIYSWRYVLAGIVLPIAAGMLVCLIAVMSNLERDRIVAACSSVYQSAFLAHWILHLKFDEPLDEFISIPALAQSLFLPVIILLVYAIAFIRDFFWGENKLKEKARRAWEKCFDRKRDGEEEGREKMLSEKNAQHAPLDRNRIWTRSEDLHPLWM